MALDSILFLVDNRKLLLRGYKLKKPNTTDLDKDLQPATEAEEIDDRATEANVNALRRLIKLFFFFFFFFAQQSSNNFRFAFLALKVAGQAFI